MKLSKIMASSIRQKVLRVLSHKRRIGIIQLVKELNSTYNDVARNLRILETEDIVMLSRIDHRVYVSLNSENANTKILIDALKLLDSCPDANTHKGLAV